MPWLRAINKNDPSIDVQVFPDISSPESIIGAVLWHQPPGATKAYKNLQWVSSLGAGVDHIIDDPEIDNNIKDK